jgi:hypothetical protein
VKLGKTQRNLVERETAKQVDDPRLANELMLIRLRLGQ